MTDASTPVWVDRDGNEEKLPIDSRSYVFARVTSDGGRVLLSSQYLPTRALWVHELDRGTSRRHVRTRGRFLTDGPGLNDATLAIRSESDENVLGSLDPDAAPSELRDVAPDGRLLFIRTEDPSEQQAFFRSIFPDRLRVIHNWARRLDAVGTTTRD